MKRRLFTWMYRSICLVLLPHAVALGQCANQVLHTTGSAMVGGVNVTVTSTGRVDNYSSYCPAVTRPFFIGYNFGTGSGSGSFTFTFSPPVTGMTLNFSGASCTGSDCEEIRLTINGAHYAMSGPGSNNACDPMAVITGAGDLRGCANCGVSGWSGTTISGPAMSSLTVEDFVVSGTPNGALFSLFLCNVVLDAEWLEFQATLQENQQVALDWATQAEINNDFFTVERSTDGQVWEALGTVDAGNHPDRRQNYAFQDAHPHVGINHYRIGQTSMDGATNYGETRSVTVLAGGGIHISPIQPMILCKSSCQTQRRRSSPCATSWGKWSTRHAKS